MDDFEILPIEHLEPSNVLQVINEAFSHQRTADWYRWKHIEGPWGASIGVAAVDSSGPIGVRLLLPWCFTFRGAPVLAHRATEAATVPRAQGRGVFTALNRWMMEQVSTNLLFSTPNHKSRDGYLKLGWQVIARSRHVWEFGPLGKPESDPMTCGSSEVPRTAWDDTALTWRADDRSGLQYRHLPLSRRIGSASPQPENPDRPGFSSIVRYRLVRSRGVNVVFPLVGPPPEAPSGTARRLLVASRSMAMMRPESQAAYARRHMVQAYRGESLLVGWTPRGTSLPGAQSRTWGVAPWSAADLEGVI